MIDALLLIAGLFIWWLYYGLECFVNGAHGGVELPFVEWWRELCWNLPFVGQRFRLKQTSGDVEWAAQLPGIFHFGITCVLLPLAPWLVYRILWGGGN